MVRTKTKNLFIHVATLWVAVVIFSPCHSQSRIDSLIQPFTKPVKLHTPVISSLHRDSAFKKSKFKLFPSKDSITAFKKRKNKFNQSSTDKNHAAWTDSLFSHFFKSDTMNKTDFSKFNIDSAAKKKFSNAFQFPDTGTVFKQLRALTKPPVIPTTKPLLSFNGGYVNYNWNFRSAIDTPYAEKNISQHLVSANLNFTVAQTVPIRVIYFERQSNSAVFRNFRDVRVEFDAATFRQLQAKKMYQYFNNLLDKSRNPFTKPVMDFSLNRIKGLHDWLTNNSVMNRLKAARAKLIKSNVPDSVHFVSDADMQAAREFLALYDKIKNEQKKYQGLYDSLKKEFTAKEKQIKGLQQLLQGNLNDPAHLATLKKSLKDYGLKDKRLKKLINTMYSVRTLAVGKTMPSFSPLTVKNVNVNGVNFEYNNNNFYTAVTAGAVDYRVRNFVYSNQRRVPQFVYAGRIGYGLKESNHIILTYFQGKKQILGGSAGSKAVSISGMSLAGQLVLLKSTTLNAEAAQSASPQWISSTLFTEKSSFDFKDKSNRAYSFQLRSFIPATNTKLEGFYQHKGLNFQNFSDYRVNAVANTWSVKADQYLWKKTIHITAAARKNDFSNPLVLQRYNANTVFKNFNVTYRKKNGPVISLGYIPSSQYTVIDSQVYENHYQVFNANVYHQYRLWNIKASTVAMFNRFYNDSQDTGFLYYNANNYYCNQTFYFSAYTGSVGFSHTENAQYTLDILDAGISAKILKKYMIGFGVKINHTKQDGSKVGMYGNSSFMIPRVGEISLWLEKSYLQGWKQSLVKNEFYSVGFTRYLK